MYKFITVARNIESDTSPMPMYIYQNEDTKKYYISRMFPTKSIFQGTYLINENKFYNIEYPKELSDDDIKNNKTMYWNMTWIFKFNN
jgi:hypothetical protein